MASPVPVDLSIVIATRNSEAFVGPCLASLADDGGLSYEIIVVDNASTDRTVDIIRTRFPHTRLVINRRNEGHCRAVNQGLAEARGGCLMVLDIDTVVQPGATRSLVNHLHSQPDVAIAAPRMLNEDGTIQETARRFPAVANAFFGRQTTLTRLFPNNRFARAYLRRDRASSTEPFTVDWVSAACMVFRRSLVDRLGPWDEGFGGYWVDADWCARAKAAGRVVCLPAARVVHAEQNRSHRRRGARRIVQFHHGVYRFYRKHYTRGAWDPRAVAASVGLAARAALLIGSDLARSPATAGPARQPASPTAVTAAIRNDQP